jgi:16S rRNA (cytidine1402-2'-O)-methyltransferase
MIRGRTMSRKRQELPPGLWVVATPIGNLEDLSPRALRLLEQASAVFCEDTRRVLALFNGLELTTSAPLVRLDAHSSVSRIEEALRAHWAPGASLLLVTDAGTPGISDPGGRVVAQARSLGIPVHLAPGPSAVTAALSVSGWEMPWGYCFEGFFPRSGKERGLSLERWSRGRPGVPYLWFESPERIEGVLSFLHDWIRARGTQREPLQGQSFFFKEITKVHEEFWVSGSEEGWIPRLLQEALSGDSTRSRGEWGFALVRTEVSRGGEDSLLSDLEGETSAPWFLALQSLLACEVPVSRASREVSQRFGIQKSRVYERALRLTQKKSSKSDSGD